jgi:YihY family inner membrane protein
VFDAQMKRLDEFQQRHVWAAFPYAVVKKFGEDQGGNLAALLSYYAFLSIFPLLLVFITIVGFLTPVDASAQSSVMSALNKYLPFLSSSSGGGNLQTLQAAKSGVALVVGIVLALWSGLAVANAAQTAFNGVYDVAYVDRPNIIIRVARSLLVVLVGAVLLMTTLLGGFVTGATRLGYFPGMLTRVLAAAVIVAIDIVLFVFLFHWLTARDVRWRDALPGALIAAIAFAALQFLAGALYTHFVTSAGKTYGSFATVIGMLSFFYLLARIMLLCAEVNVVRQFGLYPRAVKQPPPTPADRRAYEMQAEEARYQRGEDVDVDYPPGQKVQGGSDSSRGASGEPAGAGAGAGARTTARTGGAATGDGRAAPSRGPGRDRVVHRPRSIHKRTVAGLMLATASAAWLHGRKSARPSAGDSHERQSVHDRR